MNTKINFAERSTEKTIFAAYTFLINAGTFENKGQSYE